MDKSEHHFVARYQLAKMTEPNNEQNSYSVTDVLTHKCYRCPDCATAERQTPNAERQFPPEGLQKEAKEI